MILANKTFTLGSTVQWQVDYSEHPCTDPYVIPAKVPVRDGDSILTATVTSNQTNITVASVLVLEGHIIQFVLSGGSLNELFTLTVTIQTSNTETFVDTVQFTVVAP